MGKLLSFLVRRILTATILILIVASAGLLLVRLAPGDHVSAFDVDPAIAAAERHRLGLDRPVIVQYLVWVGRVARLDLGESTRYPGRGIADLIVQRAGNSALIGAAALLLATGLGIPLGILTGSRPSGPIAILIRAIVVLLLSVPPIVLSFFLLLIASRTGWLPVGGLPEGRTALETARYLILPVLALALPFAAVLERLQSQSMREALRDPSILAARARGLSSSRIVWRHAFRLSLTPVLGVYGIMIGALISGSFAVEYVMTWPGLGRLMYDALIGRDANLVAACAATGATFLALGVLVSDIVLAAVDPRLEVLQ